jgi:O-antigen/teichoic acid export membrane protein
MRKRLLQGGLWAIISRVVGIGLSLVLNVLLARMLAPNEMGAYFLALSVMSLAISLGQMGLLQVVVRLVAEAMSIELFGRARQTVYRSILLSLIGGAGVALLFYSGLGNFIALHILHSTEIASVIGLLSLSIVVWGLLGVLAEANRGFHDIRGASLIGGLLHPILFVGILLFMWVELGHTSNLRHILIAYLISSVGALLIASVYLQNRLSKIGKAGGSAAYGELLSIGWPLCLIQLAMFASTQADLWIVGSFLTKEDVAIYGAMQKILLLMTMTHTLVVAVVQSTVAELYAKGEIQKLQRVVQGAAFWACVPAGLLLVVFVFFGRDILQIVFGQFYRQAYWPLLVLGAGQFASMLLGTAGMVLTMTGHQKPLMLVIITTSVITIVVAALCAKPFGVVGVAAAWGGGAVVYGVITWWLASKLIGVKTHAKFAPDFIHWGNK